MNKTNCFRKFFTLIGADFYKLFRSKSFYIVFGIFAADILASIFFMAISNSILQSLSQNELHTYANSLYADALSYGDLGIFTVIFLSVFLCGEFKNNTIRYKVSMGYSRTCVYFASLAMSYIITLMGVALCCILISAVGIPVLGWQHSDYHMQNALYSFFALLPLVASVHMLAYTCRSVGITLGSALPIVIIFPGIFSILNLLIGYSKGIEWVTRILFLALESYVPTALMEGVFPYLALNVSLCYILWTALFIGVGYLLFTKQDIK